MTNPNQPKPSCLTCPSYMTDPAAIQSKFKKGIGGPVCGRFGIALGRPGSQEGQDRKLAQHYGSTCKAHGEPLPPAPLSFKLQVALPQMTMPEPDPDLKSMASTCGVCRNFVPDRVVVRDIGWTTGMCAAKGRLILMPRQQIEARECDIKQYGPIHTGTESITLLPEYEDAFNLSADPVNAYFKQQKSGITEPHEYPTDKDVSDEDSAAGIRAWRRVVDPAGTGLESYLPIYKLEYFSDSERAKIPRTGDDEHPELYVDHFGGAYLAAITWRELDETPAVWGEAGLGKTELFRHLAWLMCLPFERMSITASTELDDLAGKMLFENNETKFQYGRLPRAWQRPCVLCLDEPNVAEDLGVWHFIRPLTDNSKQMVLDMNKGERIARHDHCYLGLAMNPAWDIRNVGTQQIGDADVNRLFHVMLELPPASLESEIIRNRVKLDGWEIDDKRMKMVMDIATDLRALCDEGTIPVSWGIRPQIKVARALRWFEPLTAYRRAVADYLEPDAAATLLDVVRSHQA